ncbi:MAG: hypothetical protein V1708_04955 [Candidatus Micrarchaeota archaeon]
MVCYAVPLSTALLLHGARKTGRMQGEKFRRLSLLMSGGAMFGVVDHLWNGELFLFGPNLASDLLLGLTITAVIAVAWAGMEFFALAKSPAAAKA